MKAWWRSSQMAGIVAKIQWTPARWRRGSGRRGPRHGPSPAGPSGGRPCRASSRRPLAGAPTLQISPSRSGRRRGSASSLAISSPWHPWPARPSSLTPPWQVRPSSLPLPGRRGSMAGAPSSDHAHAAA
ncbi:hypothetical protein PVAP13_2KG262948 [Panicum virgatum]|uniref:Uncharacterized protein n=1 Tax=Panicum virgatum TaxID=38727 RepID=A0A8T0WC14_PANVG|nr:hypothetical protein PVAP13_2KG262948 [Panicum virgatum]